MNVIPVEGSWDNRPGGNGAGFLECRKQRYWGQKQVEVTGGSWLCSGVCFFTFISNSHRDTLAFLRSPVGNCGGRKQSGSSEVSTFLLRGSGLDKHQWWLT